MKEYSPVKVGKNLKVLRLKRRISQEKVAEVLGVKDRKTIGSWERGESLPDLIQTQLMADLYEVSIEEIVNTKTTKSDTSKKPMQKGKPGATSSQEISQKKKKICERINDKLNDMDDTRRFFIGLVILNVWLFIMTNCPIFSAGFKEPLILVVGPICFGIAWILYTIGEKIVSQIKRIWRVVFR